MSDQLHNSPQNPDNEAQSGAPGGSPPSYGVGGARTDPYGLGPTSSGVAAHILGGIAYLFWPILPILVLVLERDNKFARFHAFQSLLLGVGWFVAVVLGVVLAFIPFIGWLISMCMYLGLLALVIWGLISGFTGQWTRIPVVGNISANLARLDG